MGIFFSLPNPLCSLGAHEPWLSSHVTSGWWFSIPFLSVTVPRAECSGHATQNTWRCLERKICPPRHLLFSCGSAAGQQSLGELHGKGGTEQQPEHWVMRTPWGWCVACPEVVEARLLGHSAPQLPQLPLDSHFSTPCCSVLKSCLILCDPVDCSTQASLSITNSWSLLKLMSIESMIPSNHLIRRRPLLLLPSIFPSVKVFSNELALRIRWSKYWSFSFSTCPSNEYSELI